MIDEGTRALFLKDLERLINKHCLENTSNTPDWILAQHMLAALETFNATTNAREDWYGRGPAPIDPFVAGLLKGSESNGEGTKP
jgi:hypothetical protein